jgi:endonuclease VIII
VPEGDTLLRTARALHHALAGKRVDAARGDGRVRGADELSGRVVAKVEARGKHLLVRFTDDSAVHTHLRMTGAWHLYREGDRWRAPARLARLVIETDPWRAVCFGAPTVEVLPPGGVERHPHLATLGTDLLAPDFDLDAARAELRARNETAIGVALLDQRAVAGIGNIWRCETLWRLAFDPFRATSTFADAELDRILNLARDLMTASAADEHVRRFDVHERTGRPCRRCAQPIRSLVFGDPARRVYWCPACQR